MGSQKFKFAANLEENANKMRGFLHPPVLLHLAYLLITILPTILLSDSCYIFFEITDCVM